MQGIDIGFVPNFYHELVPFVYLEKKDQVRHCFAHYLAWLAYGRRLNIDVPSVESAIKEGFENAQKEAKTEALIPGGFENGLLDQTKN